MSRVSRVLERAKKIYDEVHTDWLASDVIGINVKLFYPPTYEDCDNCETNTYGTVFKVGGPAPFLLGECPQCGSNDCKKEVEQTEIIRLRIYSVDSTSFSRATFKKLGISIDQPQGELLTIGSVDDLIKIKSCNYAVFYSDQEEVTGSLRYKISTDPQPHGFGKDKFFFCFWVRV
jgi:hypothetical protein